MTFCFNLSKHKQDQMKHCPAVVYSMSSCSPERTVLCRAVAEFLTLLDESMLDESFPPEVRSSLAKSKSVMPSRSTKKALQIRIFILTLPGATFKNNLQYLYTPSGFAPGETATALLFPNPGYIHKCRHTLETSQAGFQFTVGK